MLTTDDPSVKIELRDYALADKLVEKHLGCNDTIMLHAKDRLGRGHHYRRYYDQSGWYIRMGKRGQVKRYLSGCEVTWIVTGGKADDTLYQFHLWPVF